MRDYEKLIGMGVPKALAELKGESYDTVKIGCLDGSSFFYIGDTERFIPEDDSEADTEAGNVTEDDSEADNEIELVKAVKELETLLLGIFKRSIKSAKRHYDTNVNQYPTPSKYIMAQDRRGDGFSYQGYCNTLEDWFKSRYRERQKLLKLQEHFENRLQIFDRKVVEAYESTDDSTTVILLIEGYEKGKYWLKEEWDRAHPTGEILKVVEIEDGETEDDDAI